LQYYNKAIKLDPTLSAAFDNRGLIEYHLANDSAGIIDCSKSISLDSSSAFAWNNRGLIEYDMQNYAGTIKDCNKAISLSPNMAVAFLNRGIAKIKSGDKSGCEDLTRAKTLGDANADDFLADYCQ